MSATSRMLELAVAVPWAGRGEPDLVRLRSELQLLWIIEEVRRRRLGVGKAAELAGQPRAAFMTLLGEHGVPVIDLSPEDLNQEIRTLGLL